MHEALEAMAEHTLASEEGRIADQNFHSVLLEATGNPFLVSLTSSVAAAVAWTTIFKQRRQPLQRDPIPDHRRVYEAIAAADPQAAHQAMADLLDMALLDTTTAPKGKPSPRVKIRAA
jgi:DNA-binding FadR family transcriptional regulator